MTINKEELESLYYQENNSIRKIAKLKKVGKTTIEYYFKKFNLKRRTHDEARKICSKEYGWTKGLTKKDDPRIKKLAESIKIAYLKKRNSKIKKIEERFGKHIPEILRDFYYNKKLNQEQIANEIGLYRKLVIDLMKEFNIEKRPKYQYISSLKGKKHSMYGKTWVSLFGEDESRKRKQETAERFRCLTIKRLQNNEFPFFDTSIEKLMANELIKRKIPFIKQFAIDNKFVCDFAIPFAKVIIECDGDYWHANPKLYGKNFKKLTNIQINKVKIDKLKDLYLSQKGWTVLRFFESDINDDSQKCVGIIEDAIKKNTTQVYAHVSSERLKQVKSPIDKL